MDHRLQQCSPHGLQAEMRFRQGYRGRRAPPIFTRERSITHCRRTSACGASARHSRDL